MAIMAKVKVDSEKHPGAKVMVIMVNTQTDGNAAY